MLKKAILSLLFAAAAQAAQSDAPSDQLLANVSRDLPTYVRDVDPTTLRRSQLAAIYAIMHSSKSGGHKQMMIRSVVGGKFSLRGFLFD